MSHIETISLVPKPNSSNAKICGKFSSSFIGNRVDSCKRIIDISNIFDISSIIDTELSVCLRLIIINI